MGDRGREATVWYPFCLFFPVSPAPPIIVRLASLTCPPPGFGRQASWQFEIRALGLVLFQRVCVQILHVKGAVLGPENSRGSARAKADLF